MSRCESRWVNVIIIALVVILRSPTLLPSMFNVDEGYYGTIADEILDGGIVYHTAVDTKPPGMYYIYTGVFKVAGRNNLLVVHILAIIVVAATALVVRRIGVRVAGDWAGAWSGIGYAVFIHAYQPGDTLPSNSEIFASFPLALSVLAFLQGQKKPGWGLMSLSGALVGVATLIRQPSAVTLGALLACLGYRWLILRSYSLGRVLAAGSGLMIGFIGAIAGLACYYLWQGNLHDAYLWAWAFAIRYVESATTLLFVLKRLVLIHLSVMLCWSLLWYFGIRQVVETVKSFRQGKPVSSDAILLISWLALMYLAIFIGWRFPGHYHFPVLVPLSILAGQAFARFVAQRRRFPAARWRWIRTGIIAATALPAIGFLVMGFATRTRGLDFLPIVGQIVERTGPSDRIFVWGSYPELYSFSNRRMATRFVSCTHLVGAYADRPLKVKDKAESVIPGSWEMFREDWQAHPPELIIDMSGVGPGWATHPMTRYPVLRGFLGEYRMETVVDGVTIYRRL